MADSDKDILITPNTGVATTHPKITFTGKDNSPVDLKILDDNTLSFEGTQGQVFSISPILNSGDIFSVNDISGIQSMAINADGTISMNAQTKSVTITNSASNVSNLILENTNADEVDGPILEFYRNTVSPADGGDAGTLLFTGQDDGGNKQEYGRITMEFDDVSNSGEEGELIFRLTESGSAEQEYMRLRGSSRQIEFNTGQDDIDLVWNSDSENDIFYCNAGTSRVGIGTNAPAAKLHVDTQSTIAPSLTFGAVAGQILQNENSEFAFGLDNNSPYSLWIQGRNSGNAARDISLQPLGGKIGIGTEAPSTLLHIEDDATSLVTGLLVTNTGSAGNSGTLAGIEIKNGAGTDSSTHIEQDAFGRTLMYTGQAEKNLFLTGAADGKVGIGTNSPASKLHVIGGANDEVVALFTTAGGTSSSVEGIAHIGLSHFSSDTAPSVSISAEEIDDGDHRADFRINTRESSSSNATPTEKLRVTYDGKVGIGTTSPSSDLEVAGNTTGSVQITIDNDNTAGLGTFALQEDGSTTGIFQYRGSTNGTLPNTVRVGSNVAGGSLAFTYAGGTTGMYIKGSDGKVGIGTTSPNAKLHVSGDTYIQSATANQLLRVHADTNSSPSPRIEMMRGAHDTWGTGDDYTDWRIENTNDLIFYSGFSSQSSGAAVERLRIHSDSDGLSINGTLVGLGQFVIFGEEADLYSGNGSAGNANGYQFSYGDRRVNVTNASNGTDFGINVPHNCVLERVDVVFGNSGNVSSGTTTFVVVKNGSNQTGNLSTTHSSGVHDSHHTGLSHTFSAGDRFNLRTTTSSRQVGPMRMTATFKRTA